MQNLFFDTSALVKRYYDEPGTETVDRLIENEETKVVVTAITVIEVISAFRRKYNRDDIPEKVVDELLTAFFDEALSDFLIVSTEEALFTYSFDLILKDDLRTLDSLQLSSALAVSEEVESLWFVSADQELVSVAENRGLQAVNPDTDDVEIQPTAESILEEYFEDANRLFRIFENGVIDVRDDFEDAPWRHRILIHLIGQRYAHEAKKASSPTLPLDYLCTRVDIDESTVKSYINELDDESLIEREEQTDNWKVIPAKIPEVLSRIRGIDGDES